MGDFMNVHDVQVQFVQNLDHFSPLISLTDCSRQDEQFSLVFTIASFLNNFLTLVNGYLFDRFGTMVTRLLAM